MKNNSEDMQSDKFMTNLFVCIFVVVFVFLILSFLPFDTKGKTGNTTDVETSKKVKSLVRSNKIKNFKKYKFRYEYTVTSKGDVPKFMFLLPIPFNEEGKQEIQNLKISPAPEKIIDMGINNIAEIKLTNLTNGTYKIVIEGIANVRTYDIYTAKALNKNTSKETNLKPYLEEEKYIEIYSPYINKIAKSINGSTNVEIVDKIYDYVVENIDYSLIEGTPSAEKVLKSKKGKCTGLSAAMVALCRAKKIPARIVTGNIARKDNQKHTWVEVYFDEYGWVTYDPTIEVSYISYFKNDMFQKRNKIDKTPDLYYIASIKDYFYPWKINYEIEHLDMNKIYLSDIISIEEVTEKN